MVQAGPAAPGRSLRARLSLFVVLISTALGAGESFAAGDSLSDAITNGKLDLQVRPRFEFVDQPGLKESEALTMRTLLGFTTAPLYDFTAALQFINVADLAGTYNSLVNTHKNYTALPDPSATNINQAFLRYAGLPRSEITAGRQIIILDDARFVGNVDFRQNMQTFDAATVKSEPMDKVKLFGAYVWGVKNILNRHLPNSTYLLEVSWTPVPPLEIQGFSYWYGNESNVVVAGAAACFLPGPKACNSVTYGGQLHGKLPIAPGWSIAYRGAYAHQNAYGGGSPLIDADFLRAGAQLAWTDYYFDAEYMLMGSNGYGTYGFQTPLATKHAFNGWAEVFLTTPAAGLQSVSLTLGGKLLGANLLARHWDFRSDRGDRSYGSEWDFSAIYPIAPHWQAGFEYASYHAEGFGKNTDAGWLFAKYTF